MWPPLVRQQIDHEDRCVLRDVHAFDQSHQNFGAAINAPLLHLTKRRTTDLHLNQAKKHVGAGVGVESKESAHRSPTRARVMGPRVPRTALLFRKLQSLCKLLPTSAPDKFQSLYGVRDGWPF